jgi:hypothetical protein
MNNEAKAITVKQLIDELSVYPDDMEIYFNGLDLYRLIEKGDKVVFEFNQTVFKDKSGKVIVENHK